MLHRARSGLLRCVVTARDASTKAQRSKARHNYEHQHNVSNLLGEGNYKLKGTQDLDLGNANPYALIAQLLRHSDSAPEVVSQHHHAIQVPSTLQPDVVHLVRAMVDQFEPAVETVDELAVKAVAKVFQTFQPRPETSAELLLRELALDGGRIPPRLHDKPQPTALRFKYALDGCKTFAEAIERLQNIEVRLRPCQLLPSADPGAALLGDYAFVPGPPAAVRPDPASVAAAIKAGDLLPALLWPQAADRPPVLDALRLPAERAQLLTHVQLTQPVGRTRGLGVTHVATVRWAADGTPAVYLHANALWHAVPVQPRGAGWPRGTVPDAATGSATPPLPGAYPFPPYLSHKAIKDSRSAPAAPAAAEAFGTWQHALVFDARAPSAAAAGGPGAPDAPSAAAAEPRHVGAAETFATWTCRVLRTRSLHPSHVARSEALLKFMAFGQRVERLLKEAPSGVVAMLGERWTDGDGAAWATGALRRRAAARWREFKHLVGAAAAPRSGEAAAAATPPYQPPEHALAVADMLSSTWVGSMTMQHGRPNKPFAAASADRLLQYPWQEPHLWLLGPASREPPNSFPGALADPKHVQHAIISRHCNTPALSWRLDKRVPPFVRGHPVDDIARSVVGGHEFRQLYAWSSACDEPQRQRSAGGDVGGGAAAPAAAAGSPPDAEDLQRAAPNFGVYPVVTPPDWRNNCALKRWLLDVPLKALWSEARDRAGHAERATHLRKLLGDLDGEGWRLDGVCHGVLRLSRTQRSHLWVRSVTTVTRAVAFGVLPEIRAVTRPPPGRYAKVFGSACVDRSASGTAAPFRHDPHQPFTAADLRVLRTLRLPLPSDLDDSEAMRQQALQAVLLLTALCARKTQQHQARFEERAHSLDRWDLRPADVAPHT
eukprot:jgi/Ulvmu1/3515/UM162_0022.1